MRKILMYLAKIVVFTITIVYGIVFSIWAGYASYASNHRAGNATVTIGFICVVFALYIENRELKKIVKNHNKER